MFDQGFARFGDMQGLVDMKSRKVAGILGGDSVTGTTDSSGGFDGKITGDRLDQLRGWRDEHEHQIIFVRVE